jgi:hypothetical protein
LIGLYDIEQGEAMALIEDTTFRGLGYRAEDLQFSADGTLLVSIADHNGFIVWDIVRHEYLFGGAPTGMPIITPDNHYLIILTSSVAHIWDIQQCREVDRRQFSCAARIVMDVPCVNRRIFWDKNSLKIKETFLWLPDDR